MKTNLRTLLVGLMGSALFCASATQARADLEVSASLNIHAVADFSAPLAPQGAWIEVGSYGRCWRPAHVSADWRPYCNGHWVWTDCGWFWESDEPWAWACYHYGYWAYDPVAFWVWVPGIEWAPAWVSWRVGGGYIGWAPLPPPHVSIAVTASPFVFVSVNRFQDPIRPSAVVVNNTTILNQTTVINNIKQETRTIGSMGSRKVVINEGPGSAMFEKATGRKLQTVPVHEAAAKLPSPTLSPARAAETKPKEAPPALADPAHRPTPAPEHNNPPREPKRPEQGPPIPEEPRHDHPRNGDPSAPPGSAQRYLPPDRTIPPAAQETHRPADLNKENPAHDATSKHPEAKSPNRPKAPPAGTNDVAKPQPREL